MKRQLMILLFGVAACAMAKADKPNFAGQAGGQASAQASASAPHTQASGSAAGSSQASANPQAVNAGLASGTAFNTSLSKTVDTKSAKAGDAIEAHTTEAVKVDKRTVLPKGTKLMGHVTEATARAKGDSQSALGIAFDRAILKDGTEVPLNVVVQALASPEMGAAASGFGAADADAMSAGSVGAGAGAAGAARPVAGGVMNTAGAATTNTLNTAGAATRTAGNTTANVAGAARGASGGVNAAGQLTSNSHGVFGLEGLNLNTATSSATQGSVIASTDKHIHLASGTKMLLVTQAIEGSHP
jgi:hypothetical protein